MTLSIYNTLTRRQEEFKTVEPGKVKMYCCGVTVYDYCHLGHARSYIVWDTIRRYLTWCGYEVLYIQNFTDIDDKIINRAKEQNTTMEEVSNRFIDAYFEDIRRLNVMDANEYPRVTDHIEDIYKLIKALEEKNLAYGIDGDVYYRVESFPGYGKLSGRKLEQMQAGGSGRVDIEDSEIKKKQHPFDFALWKGAKPGEPAWESPWGKGRPGWHIECSAMIRSKLGETIDIHGGGGDLVFPHHENEIAQSEPILNKPLAHYWMHNGMVMVNSQKMSKSLGNFTTIRELLDRPVDPMAVRLFVLQVHYRKQLDFTDEAILAATNGWHTLKEGLLFGYQHGKQLGWENLELNKANIDKYEVEKFTNAVDDDFNFPGGLAVIFELAKELRKEGNIIVHQGKTETPANELLKQWQTLLTLAEVLGLTAEPEAETTKNDGLSDAEIEELIQNRQEARKAKNFAESDRIRDELKAQGIELIDSKEGTRWQRKN